MSTARAPPAICRSNAAMVFSVSASDIPSSSDSPAPAEKAVSTRNLLGTPASSTVCGERGGTGPAASSSAAVVFAACETRAGSRTTTIRAFRLVGHDLAADFGSQLFLAAGPLVPDDREQLGRLALEERVIARVQNATQSEEHPEKARRHRRDEHERHQSMSAFAAREAYAARRT